MKQRIYLSPPSMGAAERGLLLDAFDSNWIAPLGPHVDAFEKEFAECVGSNHAVALSSGTAALHIALRLIDVQAGDLVITSSLTFVATANVIRYLDAEPVFVDSESRSWNMDPHLLREAVVACLDAGKTPKAIMVVDVNGQCADYQKIKQVAQEFNIPIIEDAAEALGARYCGQHAGTFGDIGCFSFNGNKIITTSGGGMLVTNNGDWAQRARYLASQARMPAPHYEHRELGYNYRLSNLLAALGRGQLQTLEEKVLKRRGNFEYYLAHLSGIAGLTFMPEPQECYSTRWISCILLDPHLTRVTPEDLRLALEQENIESRPVWKPMHLQECFAGATCFGGEVSERLFQQGLCLPSGSDLSIKDLSRIVGVIRAKMAEANRSFAKVA